MRACGIPPSYPRPTRRVFPARAAGIELLLGLFFAFGLTGMVALRAAFVTLTACAVAVGVWRADFDRRRRLAGVSARRAGR